MVKTLGWQLRSSLLLHHYVKTVGKLLTLLPLSSRNVLICHQPKCGHALKVTGGKQCQQPACGFDWTETRIWSQSLYQVWDSSLQ